MIETLLTDTTFLIIGTVAAVLVTLSIFKKLFKVTLLIIFLLIVFATYMVTTGQEPKDLAKTVKRSAGNIEKQVKKVKDEAISVVDDIGDEMPKGVKRSLNDITEDIDEVISKDAKKTINKVVDKVTVEKKKAMKKLKKELKKQKKELGS